MEDGANQGQPHVVGTEENLRCVVFVGRQRPEHKALQAGLTKRWSKLCVVTNTPSVMAELGTEPTSTLIVLEPSYVPRLGQLLAAVQRYFPKVICCQISYTDHDGRLHLTMLTTETDHKLSPSLDADDGQDQTIEQPLHPLHDATQSTDHMPEFRPHPSPLVTAKELAMLIGQIDPDESDGEHPSRDVEDKP